MARAIARIENPLRTGSNTVKCFITALVVIRRSAFYHQPSSCETGSLLIRQRGPLHNPEPLDGGEPRPPFASSPLAIPSCGVVGHKRALERANAFDPDLHLIAGLDELVVWHTDARRRARQNHVARVQRDATAQEGKLFGNAENHLGGARILTQLAVTPKTDSK